MTDILDQAEAIQRRAENFRKERYSTVLPELIAEIKRQAAYVARLEAAYLDLAASVLWDRTYMAGSNAKEHRIRAEKAAREALERIKNGGYGDE